MRTDLEQALLRDRDDPRLWAVYADWLEGSGDPRGALASLMLKAEAQPSRAMEEAVQAQAALISSLTPESLKTLATRGKPRLAPVFRRGFFFSAGATQASDFEALLHHPSAALLDTAILEVMDPAALAAWLATIDGPLPWRRLELSSVHQAEPLDLSSLAGRFPFLESLTLEVPSAGVVFPAIPTLRRVRLRAPTVANVAAMLATELPALQEVELLAPFGNPRGAPSLDPLALTLANRLPLLSRVVLEGDPGQETRRVLARATHVVVRTTEPVDRTFPVALQLEVEASLAVLRGAFTPERQATLASFAKLSGVTRLAVAAAPLRLGATDLTVLRFNGAGETPLVPRVAISQLAKKDRSLDGLALTLSGSNDAASAWSVGPHVASHGPRSVLPVSRRDASAYSRDELTRAVMRGLVGFDPGLDVLSDLLAALDACPVHALLGEPPTPGEPLPLFTEHEAVPEQDEEDEYDDDEEEDEEEEDRGEDAWEPGADPWGATPEAVPELAVALVPGEPEPDEDLDPPEPDAATADEAEVWTEGPVELPAHHDSLPGDPIVEAGDRDFEVPELDRCPRCHAPGEVARCAQCLEEVCRGCAGAEGAAWDDERPFSCAQCQPPAPGLYVAPSRR